MYTILHNHSTTIPQPPAKIYINYLFSTDNTHIQNSCKRVGDSTGSLEVVIKEDKVLT